MQILNMCIFASTSEGTISKKKKLKKKKKNLNLKKPQTIVNIFVFL